MALYSGQIVDNLITPWMIFSLIWSIGCTCDNMGRLKFNHWLREKMNQYNDKPEFPQIGLVYDYRQYKINIYIVHKNEFIH